MSGQPDHTQPSDRGVSELVGVVLLFGIVIAGSMMIFVSGTTVMDDVRAESRVDAAETAFSSMDGTLQSLAQKQGSSDRPVDLGPIDSNSAAIRDTGELSITVNGNSACTATVDLNALEYADDGGTTVAYEGGAIWKRTEAGVTIQRSPGITVRNGALQLEVIQLEGSVDDDQLSVSYDRAESTTRTNEIAKQLFAESSCRRPTDVTISVTSDYYTAWADHFESELDGASVSVDDDAQTVTADVSLETEYSVIDFPGSGPGTVVESGSGHDEIQVGDGTGSRDEAFTGTATFLGSENAAFDTETIEEDETVKREVTLTYSEDVAVELSGETTVTVEDEYWAWDNETVDGEDQPPLEVAFVLDESGSMRGWKLDRATSATQAFLDVMKDDQGHRVSLVGYSVRNGFFTPPNVRTYEEFTTDQDAVADSLVELYADGDTPIAEAIESTAAQFVAQDGDDDKQIMVLLTDGEETAGGDPIETAREEIPDDVTVYTIGVGNDVNDDVLEQVAAAGAPDSRYINVENAGQLDETFERIAKNETETEVGHKESWTEERQVTVAVPQGDTEVVEQTVAVERTLSTDHPAMPGDMVTVSGRYDIEKTRTIETTVAVERMIYGINETTTETVTRTVTVELDGEAEGTIEGEVEVPEERTEAVTEEHDVDVVSWPMVSMALSNASTTVDLWNGRNVNEYGGTVDAGAYANFQASDGGMVSFDPAFRLCSDYDLTDEEVDLGGETYTETECEAWESPSERSSTVHVFANRSEIDVPGAAGWQDDLESILTVDGEQYYRTDADGDLQAWNLDSNEVLVVVEAADGTGMDGNNLVFLVEVGNAKSEVSGEHLVNVQVRSVTTEDDDDDD
jgi:Mg-chelatase subunit ChlD